MECLRLRVKDIDFDHKTIIVHDGKGFKDRVTILSNTLEIHIHNPNPPANCK